MKKLMFAVAALAAGVACAEITSANVVGYSSGSLKKGFTAVGAQFTTISGEAMDLTDIKPVGYDKESYEGGSITVQALNANGYMVPGSKFFWYDDEDGTGWFDGADEPIAAGQVKLAPGEAYWVTGNDEAEGLQTAGQVPSTAVAVALRQGFKLLCNPTPVALPWSGEKMITAAGYDPETYEGGSINVQQLTANGYMVPGSKFFWYDDEDGTGWFDGADELVESGSLPAGAGIWVMGNNTNEQIVFPAAL